MAVRNVIIFISALPGCRCGSVPFRVLWFSDDPFGPGLKSLFSGYGFVQGYRDYLRQTYSMYHLEDKDNN